MAGKRIGVDAVGTGLTSRQMHQGAEARKRTVLEAMAEGVSAADACEQVGVRFNTFQVWCTRDAVFAQKARTLQAMNVAQQAIEQEDDDWSNFVKFRQFWFGHHTPYHQQLIVNAILKAKPGDIVMVLVPPEHGKTTLFEDYVCWRLARKPEYRVTVGTEAQALARRIVARVKNRFDPVGPFPKFVRKFGPFAPQKGDGRASRQTWTADFFNVAKRRHSDERDYSMVGIGFGANIAGTRTDHLHGDDLQSLRSLAHTDKMLATYRQDWLSRPGETGFSTINGTRVGDGDIYEALMEAYDGEELFTVIKLPAIVTDPMTKEQRPLWDYDPSTKTGFSMKMLERIRTKVGDDAWSRNYMQQPRARSLGTFNEPIIDRCANPRRRFGEKPPFEQAPIYIGLDPALGSYNCLMGVQATPTKLHILDIVEDTGFTRNEQIMARLEALVVKYQGMGAQVSDVVIESKNFQLGLARDERLREMSEKYGFALREHLTNINKYDADIGVPSMVGTFIKNEVDIPADLSDTFTNELFDQFRRQLLRWRPGVKGANLRQDQVMALWFVWILWMSRRKLQAVTSKSFNGDKLPWKPTRTGLLVPNVGASPFYSKR